MNKFLFFTLFFATMSAFSQEDSRFGVFGGINQYQSRSNFLSSKSAIGFTIGATGTIPISENSEILMEMSISRFNQQFRGRATVDAEPEWVKFNLDRLNLGFLYDYDIVHFFRGDLAVGLCGGLSGSAFQNFVLVDDSKEMYLMEPYNVEAYYLEMNTRGNSTVTFTGYAVGGVSLRYRDIEGSLRNYFGLNNAYGSFAGNDSTRGLNFYGKDNYSAFTITYYFGDNF